MIKNVIMPGKNHQNTRKIAQKILSIFCGILPGLGMGSAIAAERIYANYSAFERSMSVQALEIYAKEGKMDEDLAAYSQYLTPEQLKQAREILQSRADINQVAISQFLYTPQGEVLLKRLGQVIQSQSRQPGSYAIRASLILAAASSEGLTPLNVMRKFPTHGIRIDVGKALDIVGELSNIITKTERAIGEVKEIANKEAKLSRFIPIPNSPDIWRNGPYSWNKETITLTDRDRQMPDPITGSRVFPADIYLPQLPGKQPAPIIVISHGLGSDRTSFVYLAKHLASLGFVVAVPQHPGSDAKQIQALLAGQASQITQAREFIDRPLDITYLLNELSRLNDINPTFKGKLNLQQVGVIGQSFGGYTAIALAGGKINFEELQKECKFEDKSWNLSLLLQCRALQLARSPYNLRDERVKAVIAINPVISSIFGKDSLSQIKIPVMLVAGGADTVAPALPEQIQPFTWLTTANKYLILMENGTHFSTIAESEQQGADSIGGWPVPSAAIGPEPGLARRYMRNLSVAFFKTYIDQQSEYQRYLQSSYIKAISREPMQMSMVKSITSKQLQEAIDGKRK